MSYPRFFGLAIFNLAEFICLDCRCDPQGCQIGNHRRGQQPSTCWRLLRLLLWHLANSNTSASRPRSSKPSWDSRPIGSFSIVYRTMWTWPTALSRLYTWLQLLFDSGWSTRCSPQTSQLWYFDHCSFGGTLLFSHWKTKRLGGFRAQGWSAEQCLCQSVGYTYSYLETNGFYIGKSPVT